MLAQIPRKPTFPEHIISRVIQRLEEDVQDNVIPVSAGIYSEHKLLEKLQAIPKPTLSNYEDVIFYQTIQPTLHPRNRDTCPLCGQQYGHKKRTPTQCQFCGVWNCSECICRRQRYHPRAKESNSQRYDICYGCDDKFLNLTLNHPFMEKKCLFEQAIRRVREEKDFLERECAQRENEVDYGRQNKEKNIFKISSLKKEGIDLRKAIIRLQGERENSQMKLTIREKYLELLMRKKEEVREEKQKEERDNNNELVLTAKPVRNMTQNKLYSQTIHQYSPQEAQLQEERVEEEVKQDSNKEILLQKCYEKQVERKQIDSNDVSPSQIETSNNFWNMVEQQLQQDESPQPATNNLTDHQPAKESFAHIRLAEIFKKPEKEVEAEEEDDGLSEADSLNDENIQRKRAQLMKMAIEESQRERLSLEEEFNPPSAPQKCSCELY